MQGRRVIGCTAWKLEVPDFEVCLETGEFDWSVSQSLPASPAESWDSARTTDKTAFFQILSNESFVISILLNTSKFFLWRCDPTHVIASSFLRFLDHT
jgi:hypothetical protein